MGLNKKPVSQAMKYWAVGWNPIKIKARTARVAVRKWMRYNLGRYIARKEKEDIFWMPEDYQKKYIKECDKEGKTYNVKDIPVKPYPK